MKTVKEVMKEAGEKIGGFPFSPARIKAAGHDVTKFLRELIGELEVCVDAKDSKIVQTLVGMKSELLEGVTK